MTEAYGDLFVPPINTTNYGNAAHWIGIGDSGVVQAGISQTYNASTDSTVPFYEFYPNAAGYPNWSVSTGDEIYIDAQCTANCSGGTSNTSDSIFIENIVTGQYTPVAGNTGTYPVNNQTEWLTECPSATACPDLLNFGHINFDSSYAALAAVTTPFSRLVVHK